MIISFMSLEDRKVKERFRSLGREGKARVLTKHPILPRRTKSAQCRVAQRQAARGGNDLAR